jgi:hypothetical protein
MRKTILVLSLIVILGLLNPFYLNHIDGEKPLQNSIPFAFIENLGQLNNTVRYHLKSPRGSVFFKQDAIVYQLVSEESVENIHLDFLDSSPTARTVARDKQAAIMNFYIGNDSSNRIMGAETYASLEYRGIFSNIDLLIQQQDGMLKHEYRILPGGSVQDICVQYQGIEKIGINSAGELEICTATRTLKESAPISYQWIDGRKRLIETEYVIESGNKVRYKTSPYDTHQELIIDPSLIYSTYLGGTNYDRASDIAVDLELNTYVVGSTTSSNFPLTPGAYDNEKEFSEAFITKLSPEGNEILFSTFFGGWDKDYASGVALSWLDESVLVTGTTRSYDFPVTPGVYDESYDGFSDIFLAKFDFSGGLIFSTLLGGQQSEYTPHVAVDGAGHIFIAGQTLSSAFPTTPQAFDRVYDVKTDTPYSEPYPEANVFVAKFDPLGTKLLYSTFYGQEGLYLGGLAVDFDGHAFISGGCGICGKIPLTPSAYSTECGWEEGFLAKINPEGSQLIFSTYLGFYGYDFDVYEVMVSTDALGRSYIVGTERVEGSPARNIYSFTMAFSEDGSKKRWERWITTSNFEHDTFGIDIACDGRGGLYVVHDTGNPGLKVTEDAFQSIHRGGSDIYIEKLLAKSGELIYASYLGGSGCDGPSSLVVDSFGSVYVTGSTGSVDFPTTDQSALPNPVGQGDAFVVRIRDVGPQGMLSINKTFMPFRSPFQSTATKSKNVFIRNGGQGVVSYQVSADQSWISLSRNYGSVRYDRDALRVSVDPSGLKSGVHYATVKITSSDAFNSPFQIAVRYRIKGPALRLSEDAFLFIASGSDNEPPAQECRIRNSGPGKMTYHIDSKTTWLSTSRTSGVSQGEWDKFKIRVNTTGLSAGVYQGLIEVSAEEILDSPHDILVILNVEDQE